MSNLLGIILLSMAPQTPAGVVCDLDDCHLSDSLHVVADLPATQDRWSWMNHDLALARVQAKRGQHAKALQLTAAVDQAMRHGLAQLLIDRGPDQVVQLHQALQAVVVDCKGHPLAPLTLTMDPIVRHHRPLPKAKTP